nr:MAG TPA_asm: Maltokinase N-terminal cap domain [Caudoviricetes sp.]
MLNQPVISPYLQRQRWFYLYLLYEVLYLLSRSPFLAIVLLHRA